MLNLFAIPFYPQKSMKDIIRTHKIIEKYNESYSNYKIINFKKIIILDTDKEP